MKASSMNGQILGEVVVAIGVIMMVLIGMSSLLSKSTKTIRQNDTKDQAVKLVEGQVRFYKEQRDRDINGFFTTLPAQRGTYLPCTWSMPTPSPVLIPIGCEVMYLDNVVGGNGIGVTVRGVWSETNPNDSDVSLSISLMRF